MIARTRAAAKWQLKKTFGSTGMRCHICDNDHCYNPDHIYIGDHRTNTLDKISWRGGNKLTHGQVWVIRYLLGKGYNLEMMSWTFGITPTMVSRIRSGRAWNGD